MKQKPHIHLGVGSPLLVELFEPEMRCKSSLVGIVAKDYLIMRLHVFDLISSYRAETVKDKKVIVKYMENDTVYGFSARILNAVSNPTPLIFVEYPSTIDEHNTRTSPRFDCVLPTRTCVGGACVDSTVLDISITGCRCSMKTEDADSISGLDGMLGLNSEASISITVPGRDEPIALTGVVRNISKDSERTCFGMDFSGPTKKAKAELTRLLLEIES